MLKCENITSSNSTIKLHHKYHFCKQFTTTTVATTTTTPAPTTTTQAPPARRRRVVRRKYRPTTTTTTLSPFVDVVEYDYENDYDRNLGYKV